MIFFRWITFLPASLVASYAAWLLVFLLNQSLLPWSVGIDPHSFIGRLGSESDQSLALGATFILVGVGVAPTHKLRVAYGMMVLLVLLAITLLVFGIIAQKYWVIFSDGMTVVGGLLGATLVYRQESERSLGNHRHD